MCLAVPGKITSIKDNNAEVDFSGIKRAVSLDLVPGAKTYDVWVSPYADGRGALQLGKAWTKSGELIQGLRPDVEFYLFVLYTDKEGKLSKPSEPLKFTLKDRFGYK